MTDEKNESEAMEDLFPNLEREIMETYHKDDNTTTKPLPAALRDYLSRGEGQSQAVSGYSKAFTGWNPQSVRRNPDLFYIPEADNTRCQNLVTSDNISFFAPRAKITFSIMDKGTKLTEVTGYYSPEQFRRIREEFGGTGIAEDGDPHWLENEIQQSNPSFDKDYLNTGDGNVIARDKVGVDFMSMQPLYRISRGPTEGVLDDQPDPFQYDIDFTPWH